MDSAEDFLFQSLNNSKEAGDVDVFNQPGEMNKPGAMNEPKESGGGSCVSINTLTWELNRYGRDQTDRQTDRL